MQRKHIHIKRLNKKDDHSQKDNKPHKIKVLENDIKFWSMRCLSDPSLPTQIPVVYLHGTGNVYLLHVAPSCEGLLNLTEL